MEKLKNNKKIIIILVIIIIIQAIFKIYRGTQKEDFFIDEFYSYSLMNYNRAFIFQNEDFINNWHTKEYFDDYITINKDEMFDFSPVYKNQVEDVHPPLFYLLLRIASMPTIGHFTKWSGLILNIIISSVSLVVVYLIGKKLLKKDIYAIILATIYGFSKFSVENVLFIRMYQLLELNILLLTYWHIKNDTNKEIQNKEWVKLGILYITGFLTQYYYILVAVGIYIVSMIRKIKNKEWKNILKYHATIIISAMVITVIFPAWISHIFFGYRGAGSLYKVTTGNLKLFFIIAKKNIEIMNRNMFGIEAKYIAIPSFVIFIINYIKEKIKQIEIVKKDGVIYINKKHNLKKENKEFGIWYVIIPLILYFSIIVKSAPYIDIRYTLPIFVLVLIFIIYLLKQGLEGILKNEKATIAILIIVTTICIISSVTNKELLYLYEGTKEKLDILKEEYADIPCIYVYEEKIVQENNFVTDLSYIRQINNVYILDSKEKYRIKEILKEVDTSKGVMIFDYDICQIENERNILENEEKYTTSKIIIEPTLSFKNILYVH